MLANGKPELLVPASSLDVLKVAVMYGADAVSYTHLFYFMHLLQKVFMSHRVQHVLQIILTLAEH